jgi:hypothetical protein
VTYREAIQEGRRLYADAMDKAANYALFMVEEFGRPLATVCKEIADEGWNALRQRAQRLEKSAGQTPDERARAMRQENARVRMSHAKSTLKDPDEAARVVASLPSEALETLYHEARLARAGEDRSPAARKAAAAHAQEAVAPMKRAVARTAAALAIQALDEVLDDLRQAIDEEALTSRDVERIEKRLNEIANLLMEAKFKEVVG